MIHSKTHFKFSASQWIRSPLNSAEKKFPLNIADQVLTPSLQIDSEDPDLKALTMSVATTCTRSSQGSQDAGPRPEDTSVILHYLQQSSILPSAKFLSLRAVGGSYLRGLLGLPLAAHHKETHCFLHSWKRHHSFCGVTGCFEANDTTFHFLGSHPNVSEKPGGKSQRDYEGDTEKLHLPPMALHNSLLRRLK